MLIRPQIEVNSIIKLVELCRYTMKQRRNKVNPYKDGILQTDIKAGGWITSTL